MIDQLVYGFCWTMGALFAVMAVGVWIVFGLMFVNRKKPKVIE